MITPKPRVYVAHSLPHSILKRIAQSCDVTAWDGDGPVPYETLRQEAAASNGLLVMLTDRVNRALLEDAPRLRAVSVMAVGYDNVDLVAASERGILVCTTPGVLTETTADLAFALILAVARRVVEGDGFIRSGQWRTWSRDLFLGHDIHGATLGIIGLGGIGSAVARRGGGFGMPILYCGPTRKPDMEASVHAEYVSLEELLRRSDFVSIHCPLSPATRGLIGRDQLRLIQPHAILVNTARGAIVDQRALYEVVRDGVIAGAGLDVFDPEPIAADDPLLSLANVVAMPHVGSATGATRARMAELAVDNLIAALNGVPPPSCLNWEEARDGRLR